MQNVHTALYEFLGTIVLVSTICLVVGQSATGQGLNAGNSRPSQNPDTKKYSGGAAIPLGGATFAYIIPLGLFIAVTFGANVSGACFNPAVTLAAELRKGSKACVGSAKGADWVGAMMYYWLPQFLGGITGRFVASLLLANTANSTLTGVNVLDGVYDSSNGQIKWVQGGVWLKPQLIFTETYSMMQVMMIEMWGTFLFTMVILNTTNPKTGNAGNNSSFAHYTLCLALLVAIYICAPISGGGMNPAVAVGLNLMCSYHPFVKKAGGATGQLVAKKGAQSALEQSSRMLSMAAAKKGTKKAAKKLLGPALTPLGALWPYVVGPLLGATLSGLIMKHVCDDWHCVEEKEKVNEKINDNNLKEDLLHHKGRDIAHNNHSNEMQDLSNNNNC